MDDISECLITGLPITNYKKCEDKLHNHKPYLYYDVDVSGKAYTFGFCINCLRSAKEFIFENRKVLYSLLLNGKEFDLEKRRWDDIENHPFLLHRRDLEDFVNKNNVFVTPSDKLNNLFISLSKMIDHPGQSVKLDITSPELYLKLYFADASELLFYLETLREKKLLILGPYSEATPTAFRLTYDGLLKSIELQEEGVNSSRCFVAMSFDEEDSSIFTEAIEPACSKHGFNAIRVDRVHAENEQTINDLIIAEIKKSKFLISDFTKQKNGVYFEAGYGLGRGKKVIYTCRKDHFKDIHFDLNHFPVLIYENPNQLREMLENKIEAYILD